MLTLLWKNKNPPSHCFYFFIIISISPRIMHNKIYLDLITVKMTIIIHHIGFNTATIH